MPDGGNQGSFLRVSPPLSLSQTQCSKSFKKVQTLYRKFVAIDLKVKINIIFGMLKSTLIQVGTLRHTYLLMFLVIDINNLRSQRRMRYIPSQVISHICNDRLYLSNINGHYIVPFQLTVSLRVSSTLFPIPNTSSGSISIHRTTLLLLQPYVTFLLLLPDIIELIIGSYRTRSHPELEKNVVPKTRTILQMVIYRAEGLT